MNELAKCLMIWGQGLPTSIIKKTKESGEAWKLGFDLGYRFFFLSILLALEESLLSNGGMGLLFIRSFFFFFC